MPRARMRTRSLQHFSETTQMVKELLLLESGYNNPPKKNDIKKVQALRGSAAILMVATFENFIKNSMEEHISKLMSHSLDIVFDKLPDKMKEHSVYKTLDYAMKGAPLEASVPRIKRLQEVEKACKVVITGIINPKVFCETKSNPNAGNVKEMFKNLGISDIFIEIKVKFDQKRGKPTHQTFITDKLDEIVNRRHIVAHTANALNISRTDLKEAVRFLEVLAILLDSELDTYISNVVRQAI